MSQDLKLRQAVYQMMVASGRAPEASDVAAAAGLAVDEVRQAYARLLERHLLVLEPDGLCVRMAPPFSGVPTQHRVRVDGIDYFAPCPWDAFGIISLLGSRGEMRSRCE